MNEAKDDQVGNTLAPGKPAPDFKLHSTADQFVSLSELRGAPCDLGFLPGGLEPCLRRSDVALQ